MERASYNSLLWSPHPHRATRSHRSTNRTDDSRFRFYAGAVLVLTAILFFTRLGARALWSSEFRWAEIAREMLVTHNYFWPTINGHVYYDKPLGSYWLVIFSTPFTGGLNEAATRLPSAIAGLLAVGNTHAARRDGSTTLAPRYFPASSSRPASASYSFRATPAPTSRRSPANSRRCCSSTTTRSAALESGSSACGLSWPRRRSPKACSDSRCRC